MTVRPARIASAAAAAEYFAADNYYLTDEGHSVWGGTGAERLGLNGAVASEAFTRVLEGDLGEAGKIAGNARGERNPGFDLTFSPDKSVSLLGLVGGDQRVIAAHDAAVAKAMAWVETNLAAGRAGHAGERTEATGNLTYAVFRHDLSRNLDPALHSHVIIANATQRADGKWVALHNAKIWENSALVGSIYHAQLRSNLQALGYQCELSGKHGQFRVAGVSQAAIDSVSGRRQAILEKAQELGVSSSQALQKIALFTREAKVTDDVQAARHLWGERVRAHIPEIRQVIDAAAARNQPRSLLAQVRIWGEALLDKVTRAFGPKPDQLMAGTDQTRKGADLASAYALASGVRHLSEGRHSYNRLDLLKASLDRAEQGATVGGIEKRLAELQQSGMLVAGDKASPYADVLTTKDIVATERAIIRAARAGEGAAEPLMSVAQARECLAQIAAQRSVQLGADQILAATTLLTTRNSVNVVAGLAGSGKSFLFSILQDALKTVDRELLVIVPQLELRQGLERDGLPTASLERLVQRHTHGGKHTRADLKAELGGKVLLLEEASMVSARQMDALLRASRDSGAHSIDAIGDTAQLPSPEAGRALDLLQRRVGVAAQLDVNRRQRNETEREAAALMRQGKVDAAFACLGERIVESADPVKAAVDQYLALSPAGQHKTAIITSGHRLRAEVLEQVRTALVARGQLGDQALILKTWEPQHLSTEDLRHIHNWQGGMQLRLYRGQAGLERGTYTVGLVDPRSNRVELRSGSEARFIDPRVFKAGERDAALETRAEIEVRAGDLLRFTDRDDRHGVVRGTAARVSGIADGVLTLALDDRTVELAPGDGLRERLDHAAVLNAYKTQGKSIDQVIAVMDTSSRLLASPFNAYVMMTRQKDELTLHTNDKHELARQIRQHEGGAAHGLDVAEAAEREQPRPEDLSLTPEQSARVERDTNTMTRAIAGLGDMIKQRVAKIGAKPEPEPEPEPEWRREPARQEIEIERQPDRSYDWGIGD